MTNQIANFVVIDKSHYDALVSENKEYQEVNEHLRDKIAALELKYSATCKQLGTMSTDYRHLENALIEERKEYDAVCLRLTKADEENKTIKRQCTEALNAQMDNYETSIGIMRDKHEKEIQELEQEKKILNREFSDEMTDHRKWIEKMLSEQKELHAAIEFWQTLHTQAVNKLYDISEHVDNVDPLQGVLKLICERDETRSLYDVYRAAIEDIAQMVGNKNAIDGVYQLLNRITQLETGVSQEYASTLIEATKGLAAERDSLHKRLFEIALERDSLLKRNQDLDERNKSLSRSCEHLQDVKGDLKQQLDQLQNTHATCEGEIRRLNANVTSLIVKNHNEKIYSEQDVRDLRKHIQCLQDEIDALRNACVTTTPAYTPDDYDYESKIADLMVTIRTLSGMVQ